MRAGALRPPSYDTARNVTTSTIRIYALGCSGVLDRADCLHPWWQRAWPQGPRLIASVNIRINQNVPQLLNIEVNALNDFGVIVSASGPLTLEVSRVQGQRAAGTPYEADRRHRRR